MCDLKWNRKIFQIKRRINWRSWSISWRKTLKSYTWEWSRGLGFRFQTLCWISCQKCGWLIGKAKPEASRQGSYPANKWVLSRDRCDGGFGCCRCIILTFIDWYYPFDSRAWPYLYHLLNISAILIFGIAMRRTFGGSASCFWIFEEAH